MKAKILVLAGFAGTVALAGAAEAGFTGVSFTSSVGATGRTTYRYFANFDSATDAVLAVSGTQANPLTFSTSTALFNNGGPFSGGKNEDFAQFGSLNPDDSWVTIGATSFVGNATDYSPGFLNNDGINAVITGSSWSDTNDGWFNSNPGVPWNGPSVVIAQFTVDNDIDGSAGTVSLSGNIDWQNAAGTLTSTSFAPAPGALALLGLAGLAGRRRRRA